MGYRTRFLASTAGLAFAACASPAIAGDIAGSVYDAGETVALQAAQVHLLELDRAAVTQRDGSFYFADVPAGEYTLEISYIGAPAVQRTVSVPATGTVRIDVLLGADDHEILVIGQSANLASALSRKRAADGVSDVLTRDAIGNFPDQNVAESLRRLPGINVLNDQGEGRFVSIRGLDPDLNATSLNGVRVPSPESDVRSVALDVVSSDIIESIEVKKSLTPDMDADTIGASIEINTTSAFDRKKRLLTAKIEGSYNDYADYLSPKGSVDFSTRIGDDFGITGGISYYRRKFETDNIEADNWEDAGDGPFPTEVQYRDYDVERTRISGTLGADGRLGDSTELYVRGTFSQFDDQEYRRRTTFDLGDFDGGPSSQTATGATFSDDDEEFTIERDLKDRFERQRILSVVLGGKSRWDGLFSNYSVSYSKSSERETGSLDPVQFDRDFDGDGVTVAFDYSNPRIPLYSFTSGAALATDPAEYSLKDIEQTALSDSQDREWAAKFDLGQDFYTANGTFTIQAGYKGRWRKKTYDKQVNFWEYDGPGDFTLADVLGSQTYRITNIEPVADFDAPRDFFERNFSDFEFQAIDSQYDSAVEDYRADEDIQAGYALARYENDRLLLIGGVRYEHTANELYGNQVNLFEDGQTLPDGTTATDDTVIITPRRIDRDYGQWLPSATLRFEAADNFVTRLAAYRSLVRPKLSRLAPRFEIDEDDEAVIGNPGLLPYKAWNFDASFEYYMNSNGALTAAVFYKDIKDYAVDVVIDSPGTLQGIDFEEAEYTVNGPSAEVYGLELGLYQSLDFLPGLLSGFLVQANYTYTDATGSIVDGDISDVGSVTNYRDIPLPTTSKHTFNAVLGYEKGPVSVRLAGTYRSKYLDEINGDGPDYDRYVDDHFQLDLSAKLRVTKGIQLFYEWVNINNAKYFAYNRLGGAQNLYQYEQYGWTMKGGVRVNF